VGVADKDPIIEFETAEEVAAHLAMWMRHAEMAIERLAADTGKAQARTFGVQDGTGRIRLRVHLTCEPREFAKRTLEGDWAPISGSVE
jgi:hypothetical protein